MGCLVCQSPEYRVVYRYEEPDQYELAVGIDSGEYWREWVRCGECGFYYSRYSRDEDVLDDIYTSTYRDGEAPWRGETTEKIFRRVISLPPEQSETRHRVNWIKDEMKALRMHGLVERRDPPYRMLDIGGATGVLAYTFQDDEWAAHVIDPSRSGVFLHFEFGIPYVQKAYEPGAFDEPFDLISLVFVVEHLRGPASLLRSVRQDMMPYSSLYIEVPDAVCFKYKPAQDDIFNSCHLWMFAPDTLLRMLGSCGFEAFSVRRVRTVRGHYALVGLFGLT